MFEIAGRVESRDSGCQLYVKWKMWKFFREIRILIVGVLVWLLEMFFGFFDLLRNHFRKFCLLLLQERIPFAVVGSNSVIEVAGKKIRGRKYPWGIVEGEQLFPNNFMKYFKH